MSGGRPSHHRITPREGREGPHRESISVPKHHIDYRAFATLIYTGTRDCFIATRRVEVPRRLSFDREADLPALSPRSKVPRRRGSYCDARNIFIPSAAYCFARSRLIQRIYRPRNENLHSLSFPADRSAAHFYIFQFQT